MTDRKIALITGGSRGIGLACALELAKAGCDIIINDICDAEKAQPALDEIKACGVNAYFYSFDVSNDEAVKENVDKMIAEHGKIDVLLNNAGITKDGLIMRMKEEDFDRVIDVNLKGTFNCIRHVSRYMLKQRSGRIINMSSVVGIAGNAGQVNYSASKAGVIGITKSAAKELASRGITVNAVAPGYIDTDMTKVLSEEQKKSVLDMIPLSRMGSVDDISNAVAFLASDEAAYITGQVISVDGGMNI